jgi:outer membrane murein-binding lipoprotein Lpp
MIKLKRILCALLALGVLLAGCSSHKTSASVPTLSTTNAVQASEEAAAAASQAAKEVQQADQRVHALEVRVQHASSSDEGESIIITAYCTLRSDEQSPDEIELSSLPDLYSKYWRAGGRWGYPLSVAVQQQGACPTPSYSTPQFGG